MTTTTDCAATYFLFLVLTRSLFPAQPRTARVPPVRVLMVEPVWEVETPSPASARRAGKAPPVDRVSTP